MPHCATYTEQDSQMREEGGGGRWRQVEEGRTHLYRENDKGVKETEA